MTRNEEITSLYLDDGMSIVDISKRYDISRQRVHQILVKNNVTNSHYGRAKKEAREQNIRDAHARITEGITTKEEEAARFGIAPRSLTSAFYKRGLLLGDRRVALHGTTYYYKFHKCRCAECKAAMRSYTAALIKRGPTQHGTYSSYSNFRCRCEECRRAAIEHRRAKKRLLMEREI